MGDIIRMRGSFQVSGEFSTGCSVASPLGFGGEELIPQCPYDYDPLPQDSSRTASLARIEARDHLASAVDILLELKGNDARVARLIEDCMRLL